MPLSREALEELSRLSPWRSSLLCVAYWGAWFAVAYLAGRWSGWWLAPVGVLLAAAIQVRLTLLMHDAAHRLLHPDPRVNDLLGNLFCALPQGTQLRDYRHFHLVHHGFTGDPDRDPEFPVYEAMGYNFDRRSARAVAAMLLRDAVGVSFVRFVRATNDFLRREKQSKRLRKLTPVEVVTAVVVTAGGAALALAGWWLELLVFWLLPQPTVTFWLNKIQGMGEHTGREGPTEFDRTWNRVLWPLEHFFIIPLNAGYHVDHHMYPSVPWYRQKDLHALLQRGHEEKFEKATLVNTFTGEASLLRTMLLEPSGADQRTSS